jgi:hypothetical protein
MTDQLINTLNELRHWFESERKSISKGNGSPWSMWQCEEQIAKIDAALAIAAQSVAPVVPEGYVIAPAYRGYAHLGIGEYLLNNSLGYPAELMISIATAQDKAGRIVGDVGYNAVGSMVQPEDMAVRIRFENEAGLNALEQQLRFLREGHFTTRPTQDATQPASDKEIRKRVTAALGLPVDGLRNGKPVGFAWDYLIGLIEDMTKHDDDAQPAQEPVATQPATPEQDVKAVALLPERVVDQLIPDGLIWHDEAALALLQEFAVNIQNEVIARLPLSTAQKIGDL